MIETKRSIEELEYFPKTEEMSFQIERDHPILSMMNLKNPQSEIPLYKFQNTKDKEQIDFKDVQRGKAAYTQRTGNQNGNKFIIATQETERQWKQCLQTSEGKLFLTQNFMPSQIIN